MFTKCLIIKEYVFHKEGIIIATVVSVLSFDSYISLCLYGSITDIREIAGQNVEKIFLLKSETLILTLNFLSLINA